MYKVRFRKIAAEDYLYWAKHNKAILDRIDELVEDMKAQPFEGIGKPEPLKGNLQGYWSRRITKGHRIVYKVAGKVIHIYFCRGHYD
jgi:toxin YoeB